MRFIGIAGKMLGIGILVGVLLLAGYSFGRGGWFFEPQTTVNDATVLEQIRSISELATVEYNYYQDKSINTESWLGLKDTKLVVIVEAKVKAGVDLNQLTAEDIRVDGSSITIQVPPAQLLGTEYLPDKTRVLFEERGILSQASTQESSAVIGEALKDIEQHALEDNILERAQQETELLLVNLLQAFGYEEVTIEVKG